MNRKYGFILLCLFVGFSTLSAQRVRVGFDTGYGSYAMEETKMRVENLIMGGNPLEPVCVSNFPGYLYFNPSIGIDFKTVVVGLNATLQSTGARYSRRDYSGEYTFDVTMIGDALGLFTEISAIRINRYRGMIGLSGGAISNSMVGDEHFLLKNSEQGYESSDDFSLVSLDYYLKPYVKAEYILNSRFTASFNMGYFVNLSISDMHLPGYKEAKTDFSADWRGIRIGVGILYGL